LETDSHAPLHPFNFHRDILKIWILHDDDNDDDVDDDEEEEEEEEEEKEKRRE
jgi:hypothetical protein